MSNTNGQAAHDNMSMHTYARTLKPTVKRPQLIAVQLIEPECDLHTLIVYPPVSRHDHLRSDQIPSMINGVIKAMRQDLDRLLPMYRVTTIGRGQPQAPMHRQLVADNKSQRSKPISKYFATMHAWKPQTKSASRKNMEKTPHVNGKVHVVFMCEIDVILSPSPLWT